MAFAFRVNLSMRKAFKICLYMYVFFQAFAEKSEIVHSAFQQGLKVLSKGRQL